MTYIKDYKDKLFLGKIGIHPGKLSESSENAVVLAVEQDGRLVKASASEPQPLDPSEVTGSTLDGLTAGTNEAIASTDTILEALAKLQAQIDALQV